MKLENNFCRCLFFLAVNSDTASHNYVSVIFRMITRDLVVETFGRLKQNQFVNTNFPRDS